MVRREHADLLGDAEEDLELGGVDAVERSVGLVSVGAVIVRVS